MLRSLLLYTGVILLAGCSAINPWSKVEKSDVMQIEVDLQERHRCSRLSPEITIHNVPTGTRTFIVRLEEASNPPQYLGGGTWDNDGTNIIPEGALTQYYQGACPKEGVPGRYVYVVVAMGADEQPLAARTYAFTQE